ncbi:hypothetical protein Scep_004336 [Stephania cephalantha]|uniref:Uncharacterized protein n=1 Tax=Stephania cephalantha TaxID=152367 RepID=A0AAP0PVA2_9MAGN
MTSFYTSIMNPGINHPLLEHLVTELYPFGIQPDVVLQKNQIIIFAAHAIHRSDVEDNLLIALWIIMGSPIIQVNKVPRRMDDEINFSTNMTRVETETEAKALISRDCRDRHVQFSSVDIERAFVVGSALEIDQPSERYIVTEIRSRVRERDQYCEIYDEDFGAAFPLILFHVWTYILLMDL